MSLVDHIEHYDHCEAKDSSQVTLVRDEPTFYWYKGDIEGIPTFARENAAEDLEYGHNPRLVCQACNVTVPTFNTEVKFL